MPSMFDVEFDPDSEDYSTNNMSLAAYLHTKGFLITDVQIKATEQFGKSCYWVFKNRGDRMRDAIDSFLKGNARVEPRQYSNVFRELKAEMFELMDPPQASSA